MGKQSAFPFFKVFMNLNQRNQTSLITLLFLLLIAGCATTGSYIEVKKADAKPTNCFLEIFMPGQSIEKATEVLGTFSVQDTGFSTNCDWDATREKNKVKACEMGAEAIQFIEVNTPQMNSTCYQTKANFVKFKK